MLRFSGPLLSATALVAVLLLAPSAAAQPGAAERLDPVAATEAYLSRLSPEEKARSDAYFEGQYWLDALGLVYGLGVAWLLLARRLSARMRRWAERVGRRPSVQTAAYSVQYLVVTTVLVLPLSFYRGFVREHAYGLSTQSLGGWLRDQLVALGVSLVLVTALLVALYAVLRRAPVRWWLLGALVSVAFFAFVSLVFPVFIAPLFNTYEPLDEPELRASILAMARANGVPAEDVYRFDASRRTRRISANVSGFLGTMRIALNDNLLERCSPAEIRAVMGHEIGHYVLHHVYEGLVFFGVLLVGSFAAARWAFEAALARWGEAWDVKGIADPAGLPLLVAILSLVAFLLTPVTNTYIRTNEAEADIFGLNAAREPDGFAEVALKLGEYRKLDPSPLEEWIFFDHPSGRNRILMAMRWKAEQAVRQAEEGGPAAAESAQSYSR